MHSLEDLATELDRRQYEFCQAYSAFCANPSTAARNCLADAQQRVDKARNSAEQFFAAMR